MKDNSEELFPVVDAEGRVIGKTTRGHAHGGSHVLHPVVHLHVFNSRGELFLQHRPAWKDIQPDRWDTATGGHVDYGETVDEALRREVREELGISEFTPTFLCRYDFHSARESEQVNVFLTMFDGIITPSPDELDGGRFWTLREIESNLGKGVFTPNFEQEFQRVVRNHLPEVCQ